MLPSLVMFWMCLSLVNFASDCDWLPRSILCPRSLYSDCSIFLFLAAIRRTMHFFLGGGGGVKDMCHFSSHVSVTNHF